MSLPLELRLRGVLLFPLNLRTYVHQLTKVRVFLSYLPLLGEKSVIRREWTLQCTYGVPPCPPDFSLSRQCSTPALYRGFPVSFSRIRQHLSDPFSRWIDICSGILCRRPADLDSLRGFQR